MYRQITVYNGENCMSQREVYECVKIFKIRQMRVDDSHSWRLSAITCVEVKEQIDQRIWDN
jgi:hypothetical protein